MRRRQRVRHLHRDVQQVVKIQSLAMDSLLQALAFELFHDDEGVPVVVLDVVDGADVGMVELRCGARLPHKPLQRALILGQMFGDEFQRDMAAQADVLRLVNNSHSAAAQLRQHAVMGHRLPDNFHGRVWGGHSCPPLLPLILRQSRKLASGREGVMVGCHPGRVNRDWGISSAERARRPFLHPSERSRGRIPTFI